MQNILSEPLVKFVNDIRDKMATSLAGEPEDQLRAPLENFILAAGALFNLRVVCNGEFHLQNVGRPDFAVSINNLLCGFIELKQPGKGANPNLYHGHDKKQWERFRDLPNIIYTDGNEWALYQNGELIGAIIAINANFTKTGRQHICPNASGRLELILRDFLTWNPVAPATARDLAKILAPLCRLLRDEVEQNLRKPDSPFQILHGEWQTTLFPGQSGVRFADGYAQTVTFSLLLAHSLGGNVLDFRSAESALSGDYSLMAKSLKIFTDNLAADETPASLFVLQRVISAIPQAGFSSGGKDPWLYFYEYFLAEYDPELRRKSGSYYTPVEAVQVMVRLCRDLLVEKLGKNEGFASSDVLTLDPAAGSGAFLLGIIAETLDPVAQTMGKGAAASFAEALARHLNGFEIHVSPYAVAQLRISRALTEHGARLSKDGPHIYLTDTLESPNLTPQFPSLLSRELSEQHKKALAIKKSRPVLICIGNPPYYRHEADTGVNHKETGGWVRWGDEDQNHHYNANTAILNSFIAPVKKAGRGGQLKNLYNLYVYFWRWALWKVFENGGPETPGIVCFITASSFLGGPAFGGMRETMRKLCNDIWILDLGGDNRASRKEDNIFSIQTPVCITICARYGKKDMRQAAHAHYCKINGQEAEKLAFLNNVSAFGDISWQNCPSGWQDKLLPAGRGAYFSWPLLTEIFPWQQSGVKVARLWPIGTDENVLRKRWQTLFSTSDREKRREMFRESPPSTGGRAITDEPAGIFSGERLEAVITARDPACERIVKYGYRSFDRHYLIADARCIDRYGPSLWNTHSDKQVYFTTKFAQALGFGPALTVTSCIPDINHFCNRGAKDTIPLYTDDKASEANLRKGLLELLETTYSMTVTPEDLAAYVYAVLANAEFTKRYREELTTCEIRVPFTKDARLFREACSKGKKLVWLHSYGERMVPKGRRRGEIPPGSAKCLKAVPGAPEAYPNEFSYNETAGTLTVGGGKFAPVTPEIFNFEVSGLKVVQSWLGYRMRNRSGRKSSPLDNIRPERWTSEYTLELLRLLWILEYTLKEYPALGRLLTKITAGKTLTAAQLPNMAHPCRKAPLIAKTRRPAMRQYGLL